MPSPTKPTITDMQRIALERGGLCLSTRYVNSRSNLTWQCNRGHLWEATPNAIQQGYWCPVCGGSKKKTLKDMQALATRYGGKCLSTTYKNTHSKLTWQCKEGHQWETRPTTIQQGRWCPICKRKKLKSQKLKLLEHLLQKF